jgi:hypothetical protein
LSKRCDPLEKIKIVKKKYKDNKVKFFPSSFKEEKRLEYLQKKDTQNGGFSDTRDHALCKKNIE